MAWFRRRRSIFDLFDEIMREMEEEIRILEEQLMEAAKGGKLQGPYYYGVKITVGPDGIPRVEEFGNIRKDERGRPIISEEVEPLVDVLDYGDEVLVLAEMPGIDKDKIKIRIKDGKLIIKASNGKKFYKVVELPKGVKPETAKASYRNGVLEVKIKKEAKEEDEGGVEVKVE